MSSFWISKLDNLGSEKQPNPEVLVTYIYKSVTNKYINMLQKMRAKFNLWVQFIL